jgi:hypothetical protein
MRRRPGLHFTILAVTCAVAAAGLLPVEAAPAATQRTFVPVADAYVTSARPRKNFGTARTLRVDGSPVTRSYLAFNLQGLGDPVSRAFLFVYAENGAPRGYGVRRASGKAWSESRLTYANAPGVSRVLASQRRFRGARWTRVDVTGLVRDNGLVSFALTTSSRSTLRVASSESTRSPQLVLETDTASPAVTITSPANDTSFTNPQTVKITASASDDVRVRKVEFYNGGTLKRTDKSNPFTYDWSLTSAHNGMHTWTAKAYDSVGNSSVSAPVDLHVQIGQTPPDTSLPSTPGTLAATSKSETSVSLAWSPSTDNAGVAGYRVYSNGSLVGSTTTTSFAVTGLTCGTNYTFAVEAYDGAGNVSPQAVLSTSTSSCSTSSGTAYYVDGLNGNDTNAGTSPTAAWKSLSKANSAPLAAADRLLLKRGSVWSGTLRIANSGTSSAPITIGAYGTGVLPVIQGASSCIVLSGSYLVLRELRAHNCSWAGIDVSGSRNRVEYSTSVNNVTGIHVRAGALNNTLWANEIVGNNKMSVLTASPTNDDSGAFGIALHGDNTEIAFNTIAGSDAFSYDFGRDGAAVEVYGGRNNNIHHNLAVDNHDFTELGNSRSADNTFAENVVRSSLATSNFLITRGAASSDGPILRTRVYNNTVVLTGPSSQGFVCYAGCNSDILRMRNNIVRAAWKAGYADAPFDEDYDLFSGGTVQFAKGANSLVADAQFVSLSNNDLHLKSASPAIDRGADTGQLRDFDNQTIPVDGNGDGVTRPDIGAFEYHGSSSSTTDTTAPTASLTFPTGGTTVSGTVTLAASASDNVGVTQLKWYVDGAEVAWDGDGSPWQANWNSATIADGPHEIQARAGDAAGNWGSSPTASFTVSNSAAPPPAGDPVVVAAGDIACAPPGTRSSTTCHQQDTADLIKTIKPDKVLMLGDAQYETGTLSNFAAVYDTSWGAFKSKTLVTAGGSHDFYGGGEFFTYFGTSSLPGGAYKPYSYDLGNWHIVSMNSFCEVAEVGGCGTSGSQYAWLQADLQANTKSCILAMWHEPYWTSGYRHNNDTVTSPYVALLYQHGADLLLTGHEHNYERLWPMRPDGTRDDANGITAFVVGTGGKSLETGWGTIEPNSASRQRDTYGVLKLTLHGASYDWQFVPEAGKSFTDAGSASCH